MKPKKVLKTKWGTKYYISKTKLKIDLWGLFGAIASIGTLTLYKRLLPRKNIILATLLTALWFFVTMLPFEWIATRSGFWFYNWYNVSWSVLGIPGNEVLLYYIPSTFFAVGCLLWIIRLSRHTL